MLLPFATVEQGNQSITVQGSKCYDLDCVGVIVTIVSLSANGNRLFESISSFYENSYELAGAKNIVNAILVDFRGIDTMLEILFYV